MPGSYEQALAAWLLSCAPIKEAARVPRERSTELILDPSAVQSDLEKVISP